MPISTPTQITVPFATSGLKTTIPAASDPINGRAGYDQGFPAINMTPRTAGGIPPFGQDFNGVFFDISTALQFLEAGGSFPYSSSFAAAVGGYPIGALVSRTDGSGLWRNTVANNATDPEAFGAGWQPESAGLSAITMTNANVTLTALQAARSVIVITGTLTANLNLIFPTYKASWSVVNNATGAFSVTCKTAAGGGVSVATGKGASLYGDGTNINTISSGLNVVKFTSSRSFVVPYGVYVVWLSGCAGGGGGGGGGGMNTPNAAGTGGGGGGAGQPAIRVPVIVTPGAVISVTIGAAGTAGAGSPQTTNTATPGGNGGNTVFGALLTLVGGTGGNAGQSAAAIIAPGAPGGAGFPKGGYATEGAIANASVANGWCGLSGQGASGPFGAGGTSVRSYLGTGVGAVPGNDAYGYGAGASGGAAPYNTGAPGSAGGVGAPGYLEVEY